MGYEWQMTLNNTLFCMNTLVHSAVCIVTHTNQIISTRGNDVEEEMEMVNNFEKNLLRQPNYTVVQMKGICSFLKPPCLCRSN